MPDVVAYVAIGAVGEGDADERLVVPLDGDVQQRSAARLDGARDQIGPAAEDPVRDPGLPGDDRDGERRAAAGDLLGELVVRRLERGERAGPAKADLLDQRRLAQGRPGAGMPPPRAAEPERREPRGAVQRLALAGRVEHGVRAPEVGGDAARAVRERPPDALPAPAGDDAHVVDPRDPAPRVHDHMARDGSVGDDREMPGGGRIAAVAGVREVGRQVRGCRDDRVRERSVVRAVPRQLARHPMRLPAPLEAARDEQRAEGPVLLECPARHPPHLELVRPADHRVEARAEPVARTRRREGERRGPLAEDDLDAVDPLGPAAIVRRAPAKPRAVVCRHGAQERLAPRHPHPVRRSTSTRIG